MLNEWSGDRRWKQEAAERKKEFNKYHHWDEKKTARCETTGDPFTTMNNTDEIGSISMRHSIEPA